jgi:hypothetical protein
VGVCRIDWQLITRGIDMRALRMLMDKLRAQSNEIRKEPQTNNLMFNYRMIEANTLLSVSLAIAETLNEIENPPKYEDDLKEEKL